jgi:signal transduction histidine kinase
VDVRNLVEGVVDQERQAAKNLRLSPPAYVEVGDLPPAIADPLLLRQVFVNLISNAFKFTRSVAAPKIEIGACNEVDSLVYYVRDNGVGFPAADAQKLFHVFQRLHAQTEFEGTGVGLANVRKIVERHGGKVWGEGEEGKGETFYVSLPSRPQLSENIPQPSTNL